MLNKITIEPCHNSALDNQFYNIFDEVENVWIAGGFARRIYEYFYSTPKKAITQDRIKNYIGRLYDQNVDIDFFYDNIKDLEATKNILDKVVSLKKGFHHSSPFADNYSFLQEIGSPQFVSSQRIQLINSFLFESIDNCLDSFDFEVCKFALNKVNGIYRIYYTDQARKDNRHRKLNISKVGSPFLPSRIQKYNSKYNMSFTPSENNLSKVKDYCYKIVTGDWNIDMTSVDKNLLFKQVKTLHKYKTLSKEELLIMVGMFEDIIRKSTSIPGGPYYYYFEETKVDWACKELAYV